MKKRIYCLDGREIDSSEVDGTLHRAKRDKREPCSACLGLIRAGDEYIRLLGYDPYHFHKDCFLGDRLSGRSEGEKVILGTGTKRIHRYGIKKLAIVCNTFSTITTITLREGAGDKNGDTSRYNQI